MNKEDINWHVYYRMIRSTQHFPAIAITMKIVGLNVMMKNIGMQMKLPSFWFQPSANDEIGF